MKAAEAVAIFQRLRDQLGEAATLSLDSGFAVAKSDDRNDAAPKWNKLFPLGSRFREDFPGGRIDFTASFLGAMVENWKRMGAQALPADYLHRGDSDNDGLPVGEKVASGWIEQLELRADGLYGLIRWTDRARAYIAADELRYLSPTFATDSLDRTTGKPQGPTLYGCALLNTPFLTDLPRVAASAEPSTPAPKAITEKHMNPVALAALAFLGLTETATEADVAAKVKEMSDEKAKLNADAEAVKLSASTGVEALKLALAKETETRTALAARVAEMEKAAKDVAIKHEADKLFTAGKLPGKDTENFTKVALAMGLPAAVDIFGSRAAVHLKEVGTGAEAPPSDLATLKATYETEMDALIKAGTKSADAAKQLGRDKKFTPLFTTLAAN